MTASSSDFFQFIGRFHPILVHLPIGFLSLVGILEAAAFRPKWRHLAAANGAILWITVPVAAATATCGWLLSQDGGYDPNLLGWHQACGIGICVTVPVVALLRSLGRIMAYRIALAGLLGLVGLTGHFGGALTHGREFLLQYAPPFLRSLLGEPPSRPSPTTNTSTATPPNPLEAPFYESAIAPLLSTYCTSCHGADKSKGGLRLHTPEDIARGGEDGPALVIGKSAESSMIQRIHLPASDDAHMPPEGKRQLSADQIALVAWWIDTGAVTNRSARQLSAPPAIQRILTAAAPSGSR